MNQQCYFNQEILDLLILKSDRDILRGMHTNTKGSIPKIVIHEQPDIDITAF